MEKKIFKAEWLKRLEEQEEQRKREQRKREERKRKEQERKKSLMEQAVFTLK